MWGCYQWTVPSRCVFQEWSMILEAHCLLGCLIYFSAIILLSSEVGRELGEWLFYSCLLSHFNQTLQSLRNQPVAFNHALSSPWCMAGKRKYWCSVVWWVFSLVGTVKRFVFIRLNFKAGHRSCMRCYFYYLYSWSNTDDCFRKETTVQTWNFWCFIFSFSFQSSHLRYSYGTV